MSVPFRPNRRCMLTAGMGLSLAGAGLLGATPAVATGRGGHRPGAPRHIDRLHPVRTPPAWAYGRWPTASA